MLWVILALQAPPDSAARAMVYERLQVMTESVGALRGAAAHFRRDLDRASIQLVLARAGEVRSSCANARIAGDSLASPLAARTYTPSRGERDQRALMQELVALRRALQNCEREWDTRPGVLRADSLRAWGPFRLNALETLMRRYEQLAVPFSGFVAPPEPESPR